jgi:hypothetical protein
MARISTWVNTFLLVAVAVFALVGFLGAASMNGAPSISECVEDWNGRAGQEEQRRVAEEDYRSAAVKGWFAKEEYPGCGITFLAPEGDPFLSCTRAFAAAVPRLTDWSCEWRTPVPGYPRSAEARATVRIASRWQLTLDS